MPTSTGRDDFSCLVEQGLLTIPGMERHVQFINSKDRFNEITQDLEPTLDEEMREHLVSVDCALEERIHYAAVMAYYCGYRVALDVIGKISPSMEMSMIQNQLMTEYMLGLIGTYDQLKMRAAG